MKRKKKTLIELLLLLIIGLICILNPICNYVQNAERYKKPILSRLCIIRAALISYHKEHDCFPDKLESLLDTKPQIVANKHVLYAEVNDSKSSYTKYDSPFLYDSTLSESYKNAPDNTIIVASPRCRGKRYVLLLKDVLVAQPDINKDSNNIIKTMNEDEFQRQAKAQGWIIPEQRFEPDKKYKQRLKELEELRQKKELDNKIIQ